MALLCTLRDVYNPPTIDYRRDFDLSKLGRFASRYFAYTTSELVEDPDAEDGYTTRMGVHTPEPWPPVNADNKSSEQSSGASCASLPQLQHDDQVKVKPLPMGEPSVEADPPVETGCATIAASDGTELSKVQSVAVQTRSVAVQTVISNPTFH